jgi:hypothetical protein
MKRQAKTVILVAGFILVSTLLWAQNKGAGQIILSGGNAGNVTFKHQLHQDSLGDCNLCHNLFPQIPGIVQKHKEEGKLENKKVMNQCQKCHREKTNAGLKTGPVTCKGCHIK